jgi:hypothetical protein
MFSRGALAQPAMDEMAGEAVPVQPIFNPRKPVHAENPSVLWQRFFLYRWMFADKRIITGK